MKNSLLECNLYRNCRYPHCDRFVFLCPPCQEKLECCCSQECHQKYIELNRQRAREGNKVNA